MDSCTCKGVPTMPSIARVQDPAEEVAAVLRRYPGVRDAAVVGKPDARLGQVPIAAIEMAPGTPPPPPATIEAFAREHLTAYMVPKESGSSIRCRDGLVEDQPAELKIILGL